MELLCKPWCWTVQHKPTENWAIVRTVRVCSLRVWHKKTSNEPVVKEICSQISQQQNTQKPNHHDLCQVSSWFPHLSAPQHLCHAIFERPVWFIVGGLWCCQWSSNGVYILDGCCHFLLYWSWSWIEVLCIFFFGHILCTHMYAQTHQVYILKSHTCFCKYCILRLSHKHCFCLVLQILIQGSRVGKKRWNCRGFAGQFGHLLCRGQSGRSYGSQWQLALGTTKHGTVAWKTSLTLFFLVTARSRLIWIYKQAYVIGSNRQIIRFYIP